MPQTNYLRFEDEEDQFFLDLWLFSRSLKEATKAVQEKKLTSGFSAVLTNLAAIGLKITATALSAGGTEMLGAGTAAAEAGISSGATLGELSAEGIAVPAGQKVSSKTTTSVVGYKAPESFSAFSNIEEKKGAKQQVAELAVNAAKNAAMIPQLKALLNGLKQINLDKTEWQRAKRDVIGKITAIIDALDEIIPWEEAEREITWKGSKVTFKKKTMTSTQIKAKYNERVREFRRAAADHADRKEKSMNEPIL